MTSADLRRLLTFLLPATFVGLIIEELFLTLVLALSSYIFFFHKKLNRTLKWIKNRREDFPTNLGVIPDALDNVILSVSELRKRQRSRKKQLRTILKEFRQATKALPDAVVSLDNENTIRWANKTAIQLLGIKIPDDVEPVIRFKSKISGNTIIKDLVQGERNISNSTIEDFVILRKDKSPTYQLSATVDDHEMKITHVIRGDDHMINSFKQKQIYDAMGWEVPSFAHIPLIHNEKGKKLSKRDNASTLEDYIKIGIISDALRNYLLRLGWSHKDKEIFTKQESIDLFDLKGVGKSPSKLDMSRILSLNEHYIKNMEGKELFKLSFEDWSDSIFLF